ncbi:hypothetical protein [Streptomyces sp. H27-C3]|uniref:hypothetical protein n=1 Tax=Streptomyces sp. H27-C3 TaxID=3046305 RepID=UPI0024B919F2|nr:hypothetical protein [Streptomyces sp. H27-C3]MDJ0463730.1 hypothetical protein [Streptomyces sp. H27-C3]
MPEIRMHTVDDSAGRVEVAAGPAGKAGAGQVHIGARGGAYVGLVATAEQARELAAVLLRAADEADSNRQTEPVTVKAGELRRGDVRGGERTITVERVKIDGNTAQITWTSGPGRQWTQGYATDTDIILRRRA